MGPTKYPAAGLTRLLIAILCTSMAHAATPGLPFTENFAATNLQNVAHTTADWSTDSTTLQLNRAQGVFASFSPGSLTVSDVSTSNFDTRVVEIGDIDGDGLLDLIVGNKAGDPSELFLNNGTATPFTPQTPLPISTGDTDDTFEILVADINYDGYLDVVLGNGGQRNKLYLHDGSGPGVNPFNFPAGTDLHADSHDTRSLVLADINNDGYDDLLEGNKNGGNFFYLADTNNLATNPFSGVASGRIDSGDTSQTEEILAGDFNGDGWIDVIAMTEGGGEGNLPNRLYIHSQIPADPYPNGSGVNLTADSNATRDGAIGDVDGDGDLDFIAGNNNSAATKLYLNDGNGVFTYQQDIGAAGDYTRVVRLNDLDRDGDLDVVIGNKGQRNQVFFNNGTSDPFSGVTGIDIGTDADDTENISIGDFDDDGSIDVFVGNQNQLDKLYLNSISPNPFAVINPDTFGLAGASTFDLELADFDLDGDLDVVGGAEFGQLNYYYENPGGGEWSVASVSIGGADADNTRSIAVGDLNHDGYPDLIAGNNGQENRVYINDQAGVPFDLGGAFIDPGNPYATQGIALGDINLDGNLDLVEANNASVNRFYLGDSNGNFSASFVLGTETEDSRAVQLADMNNDGYLDAVFVNTNSQVNRVYLNNQTATPFTATPGIPVSADTDDTENLTIGDFNRDGHLDFAVANTSGANKLYLNDGSPSAFSGATPSLVISSDADVSFDIEAWDIDRDGDLDLVVGNSFVVNKVYLNGGDTELFTNATGFPVDTDADQTHEIEIGDLDGDGDADIMAGDHFDPDNLYYGNGDRPTLDPVTGWQGFDLDAATDATRSVAYGDVDEDGDLDIVAGNALQQNTLYLNDGTGQFTAGPLSGVVRDTADIALADMDHDGDLDAIEANEGQRNRIYFNDGTGGFSGSQIGTETNDSISVEIADFNQDGWLDVIFGDTEARPRIYLNNQTTDPFNGVAGADIGLVNRTTLDTAIGDVDNDGDLDLITGNDQQQNRLYLNNGNGTFAAGIDLTGSRETLSVTLVDVDRDGWLDLVEGVDGGNNRIHYNDTTGNFPANGSIEAGESAATKEISAADLNGDGWPDLVVLNDAEPNTIHLNDGTGSFKASVPFTSQTNASESVAIADFDADGKLDLVVGNEDQENRLYTRLLYDISRGIAESLRVDTEVANIADATLIPLGSFPEETQTDFYMSNNGGLQFFLVQTNELFTFPTVGTDLRWRTEMFSSSPTITPVLTSISVNAVTLDPIITPTAGPNGSIVPATAVSVPSGGSTNFVITANPGYQIVTVLVNGSDVGPVTGVNFTNVVSNQTISATFQPTEINFTAASAATPELSTNLFMTVELNDAADSPVSVDYAVTGGGASNGMDFAFTNGTWFIPPGIVTTNIPITILHDLLNESNETIQISLSTPSNAFLGVTNTFTWTIIDNDPLPNISIDDGVAPENAGPVGFTISLDAAYILDVYVNYATAASNALADVDYVSTNGLVHFPPGTTIRFIDVDIINDVIDESVENFIVNLSSPTNGLISDPQGIGTIFDNDAPPSVSINDAAAANEGSSAAFTVSLSTNSAFTIQVDVTTSNQTANAPNDFSFTSTTLTFPPGTITQPFNLPLIADGLDESNETFGVFLSSPVSVSIGDGLGLGIINDIDIPPGISISNTSVAENLGPMGFPLTLDAPSGKPIDVDYGTSDFFATGGIDYTNTFGTATFPPGTTSLVINVGIIDDLLDEDNEDFDLVLSNTVNATISGPSSGNGTIIDDDLPPVASIDDIVVGEGATNAILTVSLDRPSGLLVRMNKTTNPESALAVDDFSSIGGTFTINPGLTNGTISVPLTDDLINESNETFIVILSNPMDVTISDATGRVTIVDNDAPPNISIDSVASLEATGSLDFTVSLDAQSALPVSIDYSFSNVTAEVSDYIAAPGSLLFPPFVTNLPINVTLNDDGVDEVNEQFVILLSNPSNTVIATNSGTGTIQDDDLPPIISIADVTTNEGSTALFAITLNTNSERVVRIDAVTSNLTAVAPGDYTAITNNYVFTPGTTVQFVPVPLIADGLDESNETFAVSLFAPVSGSIGDGEAMGTIIDADASPNISISDGLAPENAGPVSFSIDLDAISALDVYVAYTTAASNALADVDYVTTNNLIHFPPGSTTQLLTVDLINDGIDEPAEFFTVDLSMPTNGVILDPFGVGTILDNDLPPTLSISDATTNEGGTAIFTVSLSTNSGFTVQLDAATSNLTAIAPGDYPAFTNTLSFAPGQTSTNLSVLLTNDGLDETNETFAINLSSPLNSSILDSQAIGTIIDLDAPPNLSINDVNGAEAGGALNFTVSLDAPSALPIQVDFAHSNITAEASDFSLTPGTLIFPPFVTNLPINVILNDDGVDEIDEDFAILLSNGSNAIITVATGIGTINDDDLPPIISIADVGTNEGNTAFFAITLSTNSELSIQIDSTTSNITAVAPGDYIAATNTFNFAPGITSTNLAIPLIADGLDESNETFAVQLANPINTSIGDGTGIGIITDNDGPPNVNIDSVAGLEAAGTLDFTVSLDAPSALPISVDYAFSNLTAEASDYVAAPGSLLFPPFTTNLPINVTLNDDGVDELNEQFAIQLSNPSNTVIGTGLGTGTILDDDLPPVISIADVTTNEGSTALFAITLNTNSERVVRIDAVTSNLTAVAPGDYTAITNNYVFPPGTTVQFVPVPLIADGLDESNETFSVSLFAPVSGSIGDGEAIGTIIDADASPNISISDGLAPENAGPVSFSVDLDAISALDVYVAYTTAASNALADVDYVTTNNLIHFPPGITNQVLTVDLIDDGIDEPAEFFTVDLSMPTNSVILDPFGIGTILDNDGPPDINIDSVAGLEAAGTLNFTVSLDAPSALLVSIDYAFSNVTVEASDYIAVPGSLVFPPFTTNLPINVTLNDDGVDELNEQFAIQLSNPSNTVIGTGLGTGTILDDDLPPIISIADVATNEGSTAMLAITLSTNSERSVRIDAVTSNLTAVAPGDYTAMTNTYIFGPGTTVRFVPVPLTADGLDESNETFAVSLSAPVNGSIGDSQAIGTILDIDAPPNLSINNVSGAESSGSLSFDISLDAVSALPISVDFLPAHVTTEAADYSLTPGTLNFPPFSTNVSLAVTINDDGLDEIDEAFAIALFNASNATIVTAVGTGTILDDDLPPTISIADTGVNEGNIALFTITLNTNSERIVQIDVSTSNLTAVAPGDYTIVTNSLTFPPGATTTNVAVNFVADGVDEPDETFTVDLSSPINTSIADGQAIGTILDIDLPPNLSITDVSGAEAGGSLRFDLTLDAPSAFPISIDYVSSNSTTEASDYTPVSGTLIFAPLVTNLSIDVSIQDDAIDEFDEDFAIVLSNPSNTVLATAFGTGTINDDDAPPLIFIDDIFPGESSNAVFTINLSTNSEKTISVDAISSNLTAIAGLDYTAISSNLIFPPGSTSTNLLVPILVDSLDESNETFAVQLSNPVNAGFGDDQGLALITDDDLPPELSFAATPYTVTESNTTVTASIQLDNPSGKPITVDFGTTDITATTNDYVATSGSLTWLPGEFGIKNISLTILDDAITEATEVFDLSLSNNVNVTYAEFASVPVTIFDDEGDPNVFFALMPYLAAENAANAMVTISLAGVSVSNVTVQLITADGTALAGSDYVATTNNLVWIAGETGPKNVFIPLINDFINETNESFSIVITNVINGVIAVATNANISISDDDLPPDFSVNDQSTIEGGVLNFTVSLSATSALPISVEYNTADVTTAPGDYTPVLSSLFFPPGIVTQNVSVTTQEDPTDEFDEDLILVLSNPVNAGIADGQGTGTIQDNDAEPFVSIDDTTTAAETGFANFTVRVSPPSEKPVSMDVTTSNITAVAGLDYTAMTTNITFSAGQLSTNIFVPILPDSLNESNETFAANLSGLTNGVYFDPQAIATITDDDDPPSISIGDAVNLEAAGSLSFELSLSATSAVPVFVNFATADFSTEAGDYMPLAGTLSFAPGIGTQTVVISVFDDGIDEFDEELVVNLTNAVNASISQAQGTGTITDDDLPPSIGIDDVVTNESGFARFTLNLSTNSEKTVTIDATSSNLTASSGADYNPVATSISFSPGQTITNLSTAILPDTLDEIDEQFALNLSNPVNVLLGDDQGIATILDDDAPPDLSIFAASASENAGLISLSVSLSTTSSLPISVDFNSADLSTEAGDYTPVSGTLTFAPGVSISSVDILITDDTTDEFDEDLIITLTNAVNAGIILAQATATIVDNDLPPTLSIDDRNSPESGFAIFTISLSQGSEKPIRFDAATSNVTATAGSDYVAASSSFNFTPGTTTTNFVVSIIPDILDEANESYVVNLFNPTNVIFADNQGIGTITDNDGAPSITISDETAAEDDLNMTFAVTLSNTSSLPIIVNFSSADGSADASDYTPVSGSLAFSPGVATQPIIVPIREDLIDELDETFLINLTNAFNAGIADSQGVGTIQDNDASSGISISDVLDRESAGTFDFTVSLDSPSALPISIDYITRNLTAEAGSDYIATNGTVNFAPGETNKVASVTILDDDRDESVQIFQLRLVNPVNTTVIDGIGLGRIQDNDQPSVISIPDVVADETNAVMRFDIFLNRPSERTITLDYTTANLLALVGQDYLAASGSLTFNPGETNHSVDVTLLDDALDEGVETLALILTNPRFATLGDPIGVGRIRDDDPTPSLDISDLVVNENAGTADFVITLSAPSGNQTGANYLTQDGTAEAGADYLGVTNFFRLNPGETSTTVSVSIIDDLLYEGSENFSLELSSGLNATITTTNAMATITDNEALPILSVADITVNEGAGTALFTLALSRASGLPVLVDVATLDDSARDGFDYTGTTGTQSFSPGQTNLVLGIPITDDLVDEADEAFHLTFTNLVNATASTFQVSATLTDNDAAPNLLVAPAMADEAAGNIDFTLSLDAVSEQTVQFDLASADGTAITGFDFTAVAGPIVFTPGITSAVVSISLLDDLFAEADETFTVQFSNPTNVVLPGPATGTITDTDQPILDLELTQAFSASLIECRDTVALSLIVSNHGIHAASNVRVFNILPAHLAVNSETPTVGAVNAGIWTIPNIPVGGTAQLDYSLTHTGSQCLLSLTNAASIVSLNEVDTNRVNNTSSSTLVVADTQAPILTLPADATIECFEDPSPLLRGFATATDTCDPAPALTFTDSFANGACATEFIITRTWTATDACGNSSNATQVINLIDIRPPAIMLPPDLTISCAESTAPTNTGEVKIEDICDPGSTYTFTDTISPSACPGSYTIFRNWEATDRCGNASNAVQTITVMDNTAPALILPADVTIDCSEDEDPANTGTASAIDSCDPAPGMTFTDATITNTGQRVITRTWTTSDGCGNSASGNQTITIIDTGSIQVDLSPKAAVLMNGQWRLCEGPDTNWYGHGDAISGIPTGDYTLELSKLPSLVKPRLQTISISCSVTNTIAAAWLIPELVFIPGTTNIPAFYMDGKELTIDEYSAFAAPPAQPSGTTDHPLVNINWNQVNSYASFAGKQLPTDAQWLHAAKGGLANPVYPFGDTATIADANYDLSIMGTTTAGQYLPNGYGLYDMGGNVWEWSADAFNTASNIVRGGSWASEEFSLRLAELNFHAPDQAFSDLGVRFVQTYTKGADSDGDGMPDRWEVQQIGSLTGLDPDDDYDSDGHSNLEEFQSNSDATDRSDGLIIIDIVAETSGYRVFWRSLPGRSYRLEFTDDIVNGPWQLAVPGIPSAGTTSSQLDSFRGPLILYRIIRE